MPDLSLTERDQTDALRSAIDRVGYYPEVVADAVFDALGAEVACSFLIHHEPTFEHEEIRRHVTVVVLTPSRLILAHTDEHPPDDMLPRPYTSTSTEVLPLPRITNVSVTRMVADPVRLPAGAAPTVAEAVLTVGWGAMRRIDLQPADCGDSECDADHGYSGVLVNDDFSLRMSATADGADGVTGLLDFARELSAATTDV